MSEPDGRPQPGPRETPLVRVRMVRLCLEDVPVHELPAPFSIRAFADGDVRLWVRILDLADVHQTVTPETHARAFGADPAEWRARQFFLCTGDGTPVGTASAWHGAGDLGRDWGRVHYVAIIPAFQGKGLAKPLLSYVCLRLRELGHRRAYLMTETVRLPAIRLYLQFGFRPDIRDQRDERAWGSLSISGGVAPR